VSQKTASLARRAFALEASWRRGCLVETV